MSKQQTPFEANALTISRFGNPKVGIELSTDRGHDPLRPLRAHIMVGHRYVSLDERQPAVVHNDHVVLAYPHYVTPAKGGRGFYTLIAPTTPRPTTSVVKVRFTIPHKKSPIMADGIPVQLYTGCSGGKLIDKGQDEALIALSEGDHLTIFFEDGGVRQWRRQGPSLEERILLTSEEMLTARIAEAKRVLEECKEDPRAVDFRKAVIYGMIGLFRLTTRFNQRGIGQEMRLQLLRCFFLELSEQDKAPVWSQLSSAIKATDPALFPVVRDYGMSSNNDRPKTAQVTNLAVRRAEVAALSPEDREAERQANKLRDEAARAKKRAVQDGYRAKRQERAEQKKVPAAPKKNKKNRQEQQAA